MMSVEKTLDSNNITRINDNDRQFVFIGTAHVSPKSAEEVKRILITIDSLMAEEIIRL